MKKYKNKTERLCLYGISAALCIVLGYVESLISFDFTAPGIKLGLANSVSLIFAVKGDIKGAFAVNTVRILLSAFLFSTPAALIYSLSGGIVSILSVFLLLKLSLFGTVGLSVAGAAVHNTVQLLCAVLLLGKGALYYFPLLLLSAAISGTLTGFAAELALKKLK